MRIWGGATVAVAVVLATAWLWLLNQTPVAVHLAPDRSWTVPLGAALGGSFAIGAAGIALLWLGGASARLWRSWRERRASRHEARRAASTARARSLLWSGAYARARAELSRGGEAAGDPTRVALLAQAHLREGDPAAARRVLDEALPRLGPDPGLLDLLASAAEALGDRHGAIAALEQARRADPTSPRLLRRLRDAYLAAERWADALPLESEILLGTRNPDELAKETDILYGIRYELGCAESDDVRAARRLGMLAREAPSFLPAAVAAGDRWQRAGHAWRARRVWERAALERPAPVVLQRLDDHDAALGRPDRIARRYRRLRRRHPGDAVLALHEVRSFILSEQWEAAQQALDALPDAARGPLAEVLRAEWHRRRGEAGEAVEAYARALGPGLGLDGPVRCTACAAAMETWMGRCPACRRWNTAEIAPRIAIGTAATPAGNQRA